MITTDPEFNAKLVAILKGCGDPLMLYAALRIEELEHELRLNAAMLARQCDLAREAEAWAIPLYRVAK
jgi:hypothetical protein